MKKITGQHWRDIKFADEKEFKFWASVTGKGDKSLSSGTPQGKWKKSIILKPIGELGTTFSMGFNSVIFGITRISDAIRKVEQGSFGMRMGPEDCDFFIASNDGKVKLEIVRYIGICVVGGDLY